ncbi:hypothetical protein [Marinagarivorans algicola]|uniref:hypothetical protein n=1 Tax=Marinagarivorans algicola TaxID=1513270 RepID=UPI0006B884F0|nr:hypothetical protein [Marinagarivorans algicola]
MEFSKLILLFGSVILAASAQADARKEITITEVGLSKNTNRVFVKATPLATDTECSDKEHYAMSLNGSEAYLFYSAALTAMNEGKKMRVQYETQRCLSGAPIVDVFWNLSQ